MNPDRNRGGMTVSTLIQVGTFTLIGISILLIVLPGWLSTLLPPSTLVLLSVAFAIIMVMVSLVVFFFIQRGLKVRLLRLIEACRDYAGGDRTARVPVNGDDDFAMLSMSLNTLLDSQGAVSNSSLSGGSSDAAALQAGIEKLLQEVSAVGDGDLRVQAEVTPDTLGVLADSFNYMIEELAKVVGRVQSTAVQVTNATRRILDRSAELAQASETQVAQISQTTEAVEALAIFIQNVARNAQLSAEAAQDALRNAASGQQSVRQTIDGMMLIRENVQETSKKIKRLGERSNEIGEIVRIIEDIADQTNLLALNAAIQSAMAGEHGRGFAVVADEIRLLAERSTESTKRIATLVKSIQGDTYEAVVAMEDSTQEVVKGSQLADEAGNALNAIYNAVERQAQMIDGIARAANEQTSVSEAVAVAMGRISEITRQTDAGVQEMAVNVSYLAELSEQLRVSVSTFRLPERTGEIPGSFSQMTSLPEMSDGNAAAAFSSSTMNGGMESDWNQQGSFVGNFPPLPEPGNSGSLVALSSRSGQFGFANSQDFGNPGNSNGQPPFGSIPTSGGQQFVNPPGFGGQSFGNQQEFSDFGGFDDHTSYGGSNAQQFSGFGAQNPSFYPNQMPMTQSPDSGLLQPPSPQPGQSLPSRPRWQQGGSQQSQMSFNQDQVPFQNNG